MSIEQIKALTATMRSTADQIDSALAGVTNAADTPNPPAPTPPTPVPTPTPTPTPVPQPTPGTIRVRAGDDLQKAIDAAKPGDVIRVDPRGSYSPITLRNKVQGGQRILIRPDVDDTSLPGPNERATVDHLDALIKIAKPATSTPSITTDRGAGFWTLVGVSAQSPGQDATIVNLGDGTETDVTQLPHDLTFDRCYFDGLWACKRGIQMNSRKTDVINSAIVGIMKAGQDTQCIAGAKGDGPFNIINNLLQGGTETVIFGGDDPVIQNLIPSDIVIRGNVITKDFDRMRAVKGTVKNCVELKNAQRVLIEGNVIEYSWIDGQVGYAVLFTVRNQNGRAPWSTIQNVEMRYNVIRHANGGLAILALDDIKDAAGVIRPSRRMQNISVHDNLFYDIDQSKYGGNAHEMLINNGPIDLSIRHNTFRGSVGAGLQVTIGASKAQGQNVTVRDNVLDEGQYGIAGDNVDFGAGAWTWAFDAASTFDTNAINTRTPRPRTIKYPGTSNWIGAVPFDGDHKATFPAPGVPTSDGKPVGADIDKIKSLIPGLDLTK
jgi:hypothetical protein